MKPYTHKQKWTQQVLSINICAYTYMYVAITIKEKKAIGLKGGGAWEGLREGSWEGLEGGKGGQNDVILFQLKTYLKSKTIYSF